LYLGLEGCGKAIARRIYTAPTRNQRLAVGWILELEKELDKQLKLDRQI